jgi:hypothetical protein
MSDLLSVYWNTGGQAVLEPAGTYAYAASGLPGEAGPAAPRDYFRSSAAHNGPVLPGHDPLGTPRGRFRGADSGTRVITRTRVLEGVLAWAEGELEANGPLSGWRRGVLRLPGHHTLVYDRPPETAEAVGLACHWQFAPEVVVESRPGRHLAMTLPGMSGFFATSRGIATIDVVRGRREPPAGWVSRRYGQVQAAPQAICRLEPGADAVAFAFGHSDGEDFPEVEVLAADTDGLAVMLQRRNLREYAVFGRFAGEVVGSTQSLEFDGQALWLTFRGEHCLQVRALGLHLLSSPALGLELGRSAPLQESTGWTCIAIEAGEGGLCGHWEPLGHG